MRKIILDNIIFNIQRSGGISVFWQEMQSRIIRDDRFMIEIYDYGDNKKNICRQNIAGIDKVNTKKLRWSAKIERYINIKINDDREAIFHSSYFRTMKGRGIKNFVTVYDFTYEKYFHGLSRFVHVWQKKRALKKADQIICISNHTKKDLIQLYPQHKDKKIHVIQLGYDVLSYKPLVGVEKQNMALFVGSRTHYKNFGLAVEAISTISETKLGIVGTPLTEAEEMELQEKIGDRFIQFGLIDNDQLNLLYNQACCLLYLSKYEGFGIPPIEAMAAACPVIALNKSSIPEVIGKGGILFDKEDPREIGQMIKRVYEDSKFSQSFIQKGLKRSKEFSWDICYKQLSDIYEAI